MEIFGVDIGGSGIKGAPVDIRKGVLVEKRHRIPTPQPSTPEAVTDVVTEIAQHFNWQGPIGCTFPAVIKKGVAYSAANVDESWIGTNGEKLIKKKCGCPVLLINDADAAGIAEMKFGAGRDRDGVVFGAPRRSRRRRDHGRVRQDPYRQRPTDARGREHGGPGQGRRR